MLPHPSSMIEAHLQPQPHSCPALHLSSPHSLPCLPVASCIPLPLGPSSRFRLCSFHAALTDCSMPSSHVHDHLSDQPSLRKAAHILCRYLALYRNSSRFWIVFLASLACHRRPASISLATLVPLSIPAEIPAWPSDPPVNFSFGQAFPCDRLRCRKKSLRYPMLPPESARVAAILPTPRT